MILRTCHGCAKKNGRVGDQKTAGSPGNAGRDLAVSGDRVEDASNENGYWLDMGVDIDWFFG